MSVCRLPISAKKKWARVNDAAANLIKTTNFTGNGIADVSSHPRDDAATWTGCGLRRQQGEMEDVQVKIDEEYA